MFCKQKILCIRRNVLYTSKTSKILVILTPKPLSNEGFYYVKYVRIWKANFSVGGANIVHSAPVGTLESELDVLLSSLSSASPAAPSSLVPETVGFQNHV